MMKKAMHEYHTWQTILFISLDTKLKAVQKSELSIIAFLIDIFPIVHQMFVGH